MKRVQLIIGLSIHLIAIPLTQHSPSSRIKDLPRCLSRIIPLFEGIQTTRHHILRRINVRFGLILHGMCRIRSKNYLLFLRG